LKRDAIRRQIGDPLVGGAHAAKCLDAFVGNLLRDGRITLIRGIGNDK
jgi:hypothetical protein